MATTLPRALYDDTPITSRSPKLYLKLEESRGTPTDFAGAGYGGTISVVGRPRAYGISTNKGNGIRLGTSAYIQATHHAVFTTSGAATANTIVESEATFSIHCAFPAALQNNWVIFSKDDNETDLLPGVSLRVHADGSVELRVREHKYRSDVRMKTAAGVVAVGTEHHFTVSLGYEGAWFTVDGRQAELGFKNTLAWWGLDHRHNGIEQTGGPTPTNLSTRFTNTSAIRLGRTGDQATSADIVVTKFAVFHSGTTRTARGQITAGFTLAACQALAGASGAVLPDPRYNGTTQSPAAGTNKIQAAIDACTPNGTVILSGSYTQSVNLILKTGVRITTSGSATITLSGAATKLTTALPTAMPALTGGGALNSGVATYAVAVPATITSDGVFLVVDTTAIGTLYKVTSIENANSKTSDLIPIRTRTASSLTFTRGSFFNHPTGTRLATVAYECTRDVAIDGNITIQRNGGTNANPVVDIHGVRRCRFNTIHIKQTSTTAESVIGCKFSGSVEMQLNGCNVQTQSPQGANSAIHPYALQFHGCAHYDVFNHTGFSHGWHALDHESDNFDDTWGVASVPTSLYGGQFGDCRKCTLSNVTNNFPAIMHDSNNIVYLDLHFTSGGGMAIAGFGHNVEGVVAAGGGNNTVLSFSRGVGGTRIWHCTFNNNLGQWGSGAHGMTRCNFGNLHYLTPPDTSAFTQCPHDTSNVFTNVDQATNGMPF